MMSLKIVFRGVIFTLFNFSQPVLGQLIPDSTLGQENSTVSPQIQMNGKPSNRIEGGARRGNNLFHSFGEFNIGEGRGVYFANPANVNNIFTRVTGKNPSNLLGTLGVLGNANLFLINPRGIIFGQNARLDLGGSFLASTATSILFPNGIEFSANDSKVSPLLTINIPIGLRFRDRPGAIINQSQVTLNDFGENRGGLEVQPQRSLALIGGDIHLDGGGLSAPGGRIELGGVSQAETLELKVNHHKIKVKFSPDLQLGNVTLSQDARVSVRSTGGGDIFVNANTFTAENGGRLIAGTTGNGRGGNINVNTNTLNISGFSHTFSSGIFNQALPESSGDLGWINIQTKTLNLSADFPIDQVDFGGIQSDFYPQSIGQGGKIFIKAETINNTGNLIRTRTAGTGQAGDIIINAKNINLSAVNMGSAGIVSETLRGTGRTGDIRINTENLTVEKGALMGAASAGEGTVGDLNINANSIILRGIINNENLMVTGLNVSTTHQGNAGNILLNTQNLILENGAVILAGTTGKGNGGTITINAANSVVLRGISTDKIGTTGSRISSLSDGQGNAGAITMITGQLKLEDGAIISGETLRDGTGGNLQIQARDSIELRGNSSLFHSPENSWEIGSQIRSSVGKNGTGNAGNIRLNTSLLKIEDGGQISVGTLGFGQGGSLTIKARDINIIGTELNQINGQSLSGFSSRLSGLTSGDGNGGNITIETNRLILQNSGQLSAITSGRGKAGEINIRAQQVELMGTGQEEILNRTGITVQTFGQGAGGNINLITGSLSLVNGAEINSGTAFQPLEKGISPGGGQGGNIFIKASESIDLFGVSSGEFPQVSKISSDVGVNTIGQGGTVTIETERLTLQDGARISALTRSFGDAGFINIQTQKTQIIGGFINPFSQGFTPSGISVEVQGQNARGNGGNLILNTQELMVNNGGEVSGSTDSIGRGGSVNIFASEIEILGTAINGEKTSRLTAETSGQGDGGNVTVGTNLLRLNQGGIIVVKTSGKGNAGKVLIQAPQSIELQGISPNYQWESAILAGTTGSGNAGDITLNTGNLILREGAGISTSATEEGNAGSIYINAPLIQLQGTSPNHQFRSGIFATTQQEGNAGNIDINTRQLIINNGAGILVTTAGKGNAGKVLIQAPQSIELQGISPNYQWESAILAGTTGSGNAGNITLNTGDLKMSDHATIAVNSSSTGNPGNINTTIRNRLNLQNQASLKATSETGKGGNININSPEIFLRHQSEISSAGNLKGKGTEEGNLNLRTQLLLLLESSRIITQADSPQGGSNIIIKPINNRLGVVQSPDSIINAAGQLSIEKSINFNPIILPELEVIDPNDLINQNSCKRGRNSQFIISGKGGLPPHPLESLNVNSERVNLIQPTLEKNSSLPPPNSPHQKTETRPSYLKITPALGWIKNPEGDVILVDYDPTQTPQTHRLPPPLPTCQP